MHREVAVVAVAAADLLEAAVASRPLTDPGEHLWVNPGLARCWEGILCPAGRRLVLGTRDLGEGHLPWMRRAAQANLVRFSSWDVVPDRGILGLCGLHHGRVSPEGVLLPGEDPWARGRDDLQGNRDLFRWGTPCLGPAGLEVPCGLWALGHVGPWGLWDHVACPHRAALASLCLGKASSPSPCRVKIPGTCSWAGQDLGLQGFPGSRACVWAATHRAGRAGAGTCYTWCQVGSRRLCARRDLQVSAAWGTPPAGPGTRAWTAASDPEAETPAPDARPAAQARHPPGTAGSGSSRATCAWTGVNSRGLWAPDPSTSPENLADLFLGMARGSGVVCWVRHPCLSGALCNTTQVH